MISFNLSNLPLNLELMSHFTDQEIGTESLHDLLTSGKSGLAPTPVATLIPTVWLGNLWEQRKERPHRAMEFEIKQFI